MTTAQTAPIPWRVDESPYGNGTQTHIRAADGNLIAKMANWCGGRERRNANAALIVAAVNATRPDADKPRLSEFIVPLMEEVVEAQNTACVFAFFLGISEGIHESNVAAWDADDRASDEAEKRRQALEEQDRNDRQYARDE